MSTRIIKRIGKDEFQDMVKNKEFQVRDHVLNHLLLGDRGLLTTKSILITLMKEKPRLIGLQKNGNIAIFYRRSSGHLKIIIKVTNAKIIIKTFINVKTIPSLPRSK